MDLTYQVSKETYIDLLADMVRRNDRRPLKVVTALLLTVVQMAVVLMLCVFRLEGQQRTFAIVWSLLLAGITLLRRCTVRQRAAGTLRRLEYSGQLPEDYWQKHRLRTVGSELRVSYGAQRLSCPLHAVGPVEERENALYLYCGGAIFDIVPVSAFSDRPAMLAFAQSLRAQAEHAEMPGEPVEKGAVPASGSDLSWKMDEKTFVDGQYLAFRTLYYRCRFIRPATFVRLAVSVAAVINLMSNRTPLNIAASAVILLLANLENISMIPAITRLRIRKETGSWEGSTEYRLGLQNDTLLFASDKASAAIPLDKITLCEKVGPYYLIVWSNFPAVVLPEEICRSSEAEALLRKIKDRS